MPVLSRFFGNKQGVFKLLEKIRLHSSLILILIFDFSKNKEKMLFIKYSCTIYIFEKYTHQYEEQTFFYPSFIMQYIHTKCQVIVKSMQWFQPTSCTFTYKMLFSISVYLDSYVATNGMSTLKSLLSNNKSMKILDCNKHRLMLHKITFKGICQLMSWFIVCFMTLSPHTPFAHEAL